MLHHIKYRLLLLGLLFPFFSFSQTLDWWRNLVSWDGTSHWSTYLITSPKYFGPNAFTVPYINNGSVDSLVSVGLTTNFHFSKGDNTQNLMLYGNYTTKSNSISVDARFVPYERFQLSHAKKEERRVYYKEYYKTETVGDVVVNTTIQLFKKVGKLNMPAALRLGVRMPSGSAMGAARYADMPSYWIDLGTSLSFNNPDWKWMNMIGFLVWQTNNDDLRQNDAFLFGSGIEWNHSRFRLQAYGTGYLGYLENGDSPVVIRLNLEKRRKSVNYIFRLQQGLHDFAYFSAEAGASFIFNK